MTETDYLRLWNSTIRPLSRIVDELTGLDFDIKAQESIHREYERLRILIHAEMQNGFTHIDRHKISACIIFAISLAMPYKARNNEPFMGRLANEILGIMVGFQVICDLIKGNPDSDMVKKQVFGKNLILPQPTKDNYIIFLAKIIYKAKIKGCTPENLLLLANALFVLEQYHEREAHAAMVKGL